MPDPCETKKQSINLNSLQFCPVVSCGEEHCRDTFQKVYFAKENSIFTSHIFLVSQPFAWHAKHQPTKPASDIYL